VKKQISEVTILLYLLFSDLL